MKTFLNLSLIVAATFGTVAKANTRTCFIMTASGNYLTAVGGGGRITDVIHSDATQARSWETFKIVESASAPGTYGIKTLTGNYLTAVSGGGRIDDVIHSDATKFRNWEQFRIEPVGDDYVALKTSRGYYLTAVSSGGREVDVIHSDATQVLEWEKFKLICKK
jgi:hypothetical protein